MERWQGFTSYQVSKVYGIGYNPFNYSSTTKGVVYSLRMNTEWDDEMIMIGCRGAERHRDDNFDTPYTALVVIRNDGYIAKPYGHKKERYEIQVPGTVIILNTHQYHHVSRDDRVWSSIKPRGRWWIGVATVSYEHPTREWVMDRFSSLFQSPFSKPVE